MKDPPERGHFLLRIVNNLLPRSLRLEAAERRGRHARSTRVPALRGRPETIPSGPLSRALGATAGPGEAQKNPAATGGRQPPLTQFPSPSAARSGILCAIQRDATPTLLRNSRPAAIPLAAGSTFPIADYAPATAVASPGVAPQICRRVSTPVRFKVRVAPNECSPPAWLLEGTKRRPDPQAAGGTLLCIDSYVMCQLVRAPIRRSNKENPSR